MEMTVIWQTRKGEKPRTDARTATTHLHEHSSPDLRLYPGTYLGP